MVTKSISKSVRLTNELYGYIMDSPGKGFNEKFENIILEAKNSVAERSRLLDILTEEVNEKRRELHDLIDSKRYLSEFFSRYERMERDLEALEASLKSACNCAILEEETAVDD